MHTIRILGLLQMNGHVNLSKTFIEKKYKHFLKLKKKWEWEMIHHLMIS